MAGRITSTLLLVGSLPVDSTEEAFRAGAELFGDLVFALPDGETGPAGGMGRLRAQQPPAPPPGHRDRRRGDLIADGIPRHAYETPIFEVRDGRRASCASTRWPRIDDALAS